MSMKLIFDQNACLDLLRLYEHGKTVKELAEERFVCVETMRSAIQKGRALREQGIGCAPEMSEPLACDRVERELPEEVQLAVQMHLNDLLQQAEALTAELEDVRARAKKLERWLAKEDAAC